MAAGYISSTSGIGVADPYDAGLYEAQQDALKRIDEQKKLGLAEQKQKYDFIKATTSDLTAPTGVMPEHASTTIKSSMDEYAKLKSQYLQEAAKNPTSPQALKAREAMDMKRNEYQSRVADSKGVYDVIKANEAKVASNPTKYNLDAFRDAIVKVRTLPQGSPEYYQAVQTLQAPPAAVSSMEIAQQFAKTQKATTETSAPQKDKFGNITAQVKKGLFANDEDALEAAQNLMATNYKGFGTSIANEFEEIASDPNRSDFKTYVDGAKKLGVSPLEYYAAQVVKANGYQQETLQKLGSDPYYKAYQTKTAQLQAEGDNEAEQLSADLLNLAAVFEKKPDILMTLSDEDRQVQAVKAYGAEPIATAPFLEGRVIGKTTSYVSSFDVNAKGEKVESVKNVDSDLIVNKAYVDKDGRLYLSTSDGNTRVYKNLTQALPLITYNKDNDKASKNISAAKKLAESMGALKDDGVLIESGKLVKLSPDEKKKSDAIFSIGVGAMGQKQQPPKTVPTDVDNTGKPIDAKGAMKQKVEPKTKVVDGFTIPANATPKYGAKTGKLIGYELPDGTKFKFQ